MHVVVVGAGLSGLTVARALHDAGIEVQVVEARDRIGGRTFTVQLPWSDLEPALRWPGAPAAQPAGSDPSASSPACSDDRLSALSAELSATTVAPEPEPIRPADAVPVTPTTIIYPATAAASIAKLTDVTAELAPATSIGTVDLGAAWIHGRRHNVVAQLADAHGIASAYHELDCDDSAGYDAVSQRHFTEAQWRVLHQTYTQFPEQLPTFRRKLGAIANLTQARDLWLAQKRLQGAEARAARYAIDHWLVTLDNASPPELTSLEAFWEDEDLGLDDHVMAGGYASIVRVLARGLDIRLNANVTRIAFAGDQLEVRTADGQTLSASHVVVTVPLGVLKASHIEFCPPLPPAKQQAINRLAMASFEKVVLRYDRKFWPPGSSSYIAADEEGGWGEFTDMTLAAGGAPTLVCLTGGRFSTEQRARMSDAEILAQVTDIAKILFQLTELPPLLGYVVTRWWHDPFSHGSYSYVPVGASQRDMDVLARTVDRRLLFAGEATCSAFHSTAHGAVKSGLRVARELGVKTFKLAGLR